MGISSTLRHTLVALALTSTVGVTAQEPPCNPTTPRPNLGALELRFHAAPDGEALRAHNLDGVTIEVDTSGLALRRHDDRLEVGHPRVTSWQPRAGTALASRTRVRHGRDETLWREHLSEHADVAIAARDGVDLELSGDGRRLRSRWTLAAGTDPQAVAWHYGDADVAIGQTALGETVVTTQAGWQHLLEPPRAFQDGDEGSIAVDTALVDQGDALGIELGTYDASRPLVVETTLIYADWIDGIAATRSEGGIVVAGHGADDMAIVRLDESGTRVDTSLVIGGAGRDQARSVTTTTDGRVIVLGTTDSTDLPTLAAMQKAHGGGADLALLALGNDLRPITVSYLGGAGDDHARAVTTDAHDRVVVVSHSEGEGVPRSERPIDTFETVFPSSGEQHEGLQVSTIATGLDHITASGEASGPTVGAVQAWIDCRGVLQVGVVAHTTTSCSPFQDIHWIPHWDVSAANGNPNWSELALRWKEAVTPPTLQTALLPGTMPDPLNVDHGDHALLDAAEAVAFTNNGNVTNPAGTWQSNWARSTGELAVGAALYLSWWSSPTFVDLAPITPPAWSMMISKVAFEVLTGGVSTMQQLCDPVGWGPTRGGVIDVIDEDCAAWANLDDPVPAAKICEVEVSFWSPSGNAFNAWQDFDGIQFDIMFSNSPQGPNGVAYVADPPTGAGHVSRYLEELTGRVAPELGVDTKIERVRYEAGRAVSSVVETATVRLGDLHP